MRLGRRLRYSAMPVEVVQETTILAFGTRGSSALISWVQSPTSPTLTACSQIIWRLVSACLMAASYRANRWPKPVVQSAGRRRSRQK